MSAVDPWLYSIQDAPDGPGPLGPDDRGVQLTWDGGRFVAQRPAPAEPTQIFVGSGGRTGGGTSTIAGATDFGGTTGPGTDGYAIVWDDDAGAFTLATFEAAGAAAAAITAHVEEGDPHDGYLLADGSRPGATSQAQAFGAGVVTGIVRPASDGATAVRVQNAAGTSDLLTVNTITGTVRLATQPANDLDAITRGYSLSRGMNLITNGSGLLGNNYNFSGLIFDPVEAHGGGGSFRYTGAYAVRTSDELIPVDPEKYYRLSVWAKAGDTGGGNFDAVNKQGFGAACYDIDGNRIAPEFFMIYPGSARTTLAAPLNPGDATVTLASASGWYTSSIELFRHITWYPYSNAKGYTYPAYTYSRLMTGNYSHYYTNGAWASGGISGNTITLTAPWLGPALPAGTPVANGVSGGTYKYVAMNFNTTVPNSWTKYTGVIGGFDTAATNPVDKFPYGTAFIRVVTLNNITGTATTNIIRWSDIHMSEITVRNLERFDASADLTLQSYTTAGRPAAGTAGRVIWNSTTARPNYDTGAAWILSNGTDATNGSAINNTISTAATNTVTNNFTAVVNSTGTPATGFGAALNFQLKSSTTAGQDAGRIQALWNVATHASRAADVLMTTYYITTEQEFIRGRGASGGVQLGFYGAPPQSKQTVTGSRGGNAALASLLTALANLGLITDSSS